MMRRRHFLGLLPACLGAGCSEEKPAPKLRFPKVPRRVMATTPFAQSLAEVIGGRAVQAHSLVPRGVIPEHFKPAAPDLTRLHTSDIVIDHGLGLEQGWGVDFAAMKDAGQALITATSTIPAERILYPSGPGGPPDPRVWTSPDLLSQMGEAITAGLKQAMPALAEYFDRRMYQLRNRLKDLMDATKQDAERLKKESRFLLTSHDSMQYFAAAFGLEARALAPAAEQVPEKLPGGFHDWILKNKVKVLFREPSARQESLRLLLFDLKTDTSTIIHTLTLPPDKTVAATSNKSVIVDSAEGALQHLCSIVTFMLLTR